MTEEYVEVRVFINLGGYEMEAIVDMPESVAADGEKRFNWIMNSIEVDWED